jgi:hypothetical protein
MPTDLENLQTRRSAIVAELAALTGESAGGKPSYSIDGQQVDHSNASTASSPPPTARSKWR